MGNEEERYTRGTGESSDEFVYRCKELPGEEFEVTVSVHQGSVNICCQLFLQSRLTWLQRM